MGIIKDLLNKIAKISDRLFNWLTANDEMQLNGIKEVKKIADNQFELSMQYNQSASGSKSSPYNYRCVIKYPKYFTNDSPCTLTVYDSMEKNAKSQTKNNVLGKDFVKVAEDTLLSMLDDDTKKSFGIKGCKRMTVTLQRVVSAKETTISLTAIKADYDILDAYANLNSLLTSEDFTNTITEEPISFEIAEYDDTFDIEPCEHIGVTDAAAYALSELLCASIDFYMNMQILHWYAAYNQTLFGCIGGCLWDSQTWIDKLGMWYIEMTDTVCDTHKCAFNTVNITDDTDTDLAVIAANVIGTYVDIMEAQCVNLPRDMQTELNMYIRRMKETKEIGLKQAEF